MSHSLLRIVCLDIPSPPDYGGAMDMFYRIKALHSLGIAIELHAFAYGGRTPSAELQQCCQAIHLYPRRNTPLLLAHPKPYMALCRHNKDLLRELSRSHSPLLLEGTHTCSLLDALPRPELATVRAHNIEAQYYRSLAHDEPRIARKLFLWSEAAKLAYYEPRWLRKAGAIAAISPHDAHHLQTQLVPGPQVALIGPFTGLSPALPSGLGQFALFHGNLAVPENHFAAQFLARHVAPIPGVPLVIAGRNPRPELQSLCAQRSIQLVANPAESALTQLIQNASVHLLPGERSDGIKLKVLRALHQGRHCLASPALVKNTAMENLCHIAHNAKEFRDKAQQLHTSPLSETESRERIASLTENYNDQQNARKLLELMKISI